jgi:multidrug efflux pump subunit AcrB
MMSLFAIIVTIGIIVDDAIVVGENIYSKREQGKSFMVAAIEGARQMALPVTFAIMTNIAAFLPMLFVPGITGKFFKVIPQVVIFIFLISLTEALFILPAHLSHRSKRDERGIIAWLNRNRQWFARFFEWLNSRTYQPFLRFALKWRYATLGLSLFVFIFVIGLVASGRIEFSFMPKIESERIDEIVAENGGMSMIRGIFSQIGSPPMQSGPVQVGSGLSGGHRTNVMVYMVPMDQRNINAEEFVQQWNEKLGNIPGLETLSFTYSAGPGSSKPVSLLISHPDSATLEKAASEMANSLESYAGLRDIDDGFSGGKVQLDFKMKPSAQSIGITAVDLARQVRSAFYGAEALRIQRGRDEVRVYVRRPENERTSEYDIEEMMILAPNGSEIPLKEAAEVIRGRSYTEILRTDGKRTLTVSADIEQGKANANKVMASLLQNEVPRLMEKYPGLNYGFEGQQRDMQEAMSSLGIGFLMAMFGIFALLAIPFKSYSQPLIIMTTIPFGIIGAVIGHFLMGYELSIISMFGVVALAGVVVNGGLILVNDANKRRWEGVGRFESIFQAGARRFRPIVLTSVTTFIGLAPMIFETSLQARFLIPMAISLGFGILFSTAISLVMVPCLYLILFDIKDLLGVPERRESMALDEAPVEPVADGAPGGAPGITADR